MAMTVVTPLRAKGDFDAFIAWAQTEQPARMRAYGKLFCLALGAKIHAALASATPVVTGYLRLSLSARLNGNGGYTPPDLKGIKHDMPGEFIGQWGIADAVTADALASFGLGDVLEIGYTAIYARKIEDLYGMVKDTVSALPSMVREITQGIQRGASLT